jgi:hypothetical protein
MLGQRQRKACGCPWAESGEGAAVCAAVCRVLSCHEPLDRCLPLPGKAMHLCVLLAWAVAACGQARSCWRLAAGEANSNGDYASRLRGVVYWPGLGQHMACLFCIRQASILQAAVYFRLKRCRVRTAAAAAFFRKALHGAPSCEQAPPSVPKMVAVHSWCSQLAVGRLYAGPAALAGCCCCCLAHSRDFWSLRFSVWCAGCCLMWQVDAPVRGWRHEAIALVTPAGDDHALAGQLPAAEARVVEYEVVPDGSSSIVCCNAGTAVDEVWQPAAGLR